TGSMCGGSPTTKIAALKTATPHLLGQLKAACMVNGDVYVSIIPFSKDVNVGSSNYTADWIDWSDWDQQNGSCNKNYNHYNSCINNSGTWTPAAHSTWNGCVTDRDQNYDTMNSPPGSGALFPAEQFSGCSASLMTQSYDWDALNAKVDAMVATGNTNQAIGLAWGWQSLTQSAPLNAPAKDTTTYQYQDIVILLTDGMNTQDRWYSNASSIDNRQRILCDNVKNGRVPSYSIQLNTSNDATSPVLHHAARH